LINRDESCAGWIDVFSCFEDDLFLEVKGKHMLTSAANWKEGEPSLDSAVSWKDGEPSLDSAVSWKEGKPSLDSAANWKEGEPSLASAASWKEAYRSETFWMKSLLSSEICMRGKICYRMSLEKEYETESWEMIYKCEKEFESRCEMERDIYDRCSSAVTWRKMYNASDSSGRDFSDSDDDDYRYNPYNSDYEGEYEYEDYEEEDIWRNCYR
jgi:hypothetical protein